MNSDTLTNNHGAAQTRTDSSILPRVDIFETDQEILLAADLPGVAPAHVDLRYERGELTLHGARPSRPRTGGEFLDERHEGDFHRVFQLHESIDAERIGADFKQGVLTIHLPKQEAVKPRRVAVKTA